MKRLIYGFVIVCLCWWINPVWGQQVGDDTYDPVVMDPAFEFGKGPAVYIDEAHNNFHTLNGRYQPFARLLERDGYRLAALKKGFSQTELEKVDILVISNALHQQNIEEWKLPTPSAFSDEEIEAVRLWVKNGGALFLIADHMPMGGAAAKLAAKFGFKFYNGFAYHKQTKGRALFSLKDGTLKNHVMVRGRNQDERVTEVYSFMGQAFEIPDGADPILEFDDNGYQLLPVTAWEFKADTKRIPTKGFCQGAVMKYGKGRLALFGEAAMFTSQLAGPEKKAVGMTSPEASQNQQFLLNILHWLSGVLK